MGFSLAACSSPSTEVEDAWIREAPPGAQALAGYLLLKNNSAQPKMLSKAESGDFGAIEFHRTTVEGGIARMSMDKDVEIPAGGVVTFEPGGRHLMLLRPRRTLASGDSVDVTLTFRDGSRLATKLEVRKP